MKKKVVMLPGWIRKLHTSKNGNVVLVSYSCDTEIISQYINTPTPQFKELKGGTYNMDKTYLTAHGKVFVFYRAIENKDVEVLAKLHAPTNKTTYKDFLKYNICKTINFYDNATQIIPDVQNLQLVIRTSNSSRKIRKSLDLLKSYHVHIAIYNDSAKEVEALNVMLPMCLHEELCCLNRADDIRKAICDKMALL